MQTTVLESAMTTKNSAAFVTFGITLLLGWILSCNGQKQNLTIGFIPALSDKRNPMRTTSKYFYGAFMVALERINTENKVPGFLMVPSICDNQADTVVSMRCMLRQRAEGVKVYIGPEASCESEADLAAAFNVPLLSFKCGESGATSTRQRSTFARTTPDATKVVRSVTTLLKHYGWKRFSLIYGLGDPWREMAAQLKEVVENEVNMKLNHEKTFEEPYVAKDQMPRIVTDTYHDTRVYVFLGDDHALIDFMRFMHHRYNLEGQYAVIAMSDKPYDSSMREKYFKQFLEKDLKEKMVSAFQAVLLLCPRGPLPTREYRSFVNATVRLASRPPLSIPPLPPIIRPETAVPVYGAYLYDAVMLYARGVREVLASGGNFTNGTAIIATILNRKYASIQGYEMYIDEKGDAEANYTVLALQPDANATFGRSMHPVGQFIRTENHTLRFDLQKKILWIGGKAPVDVPECGYFGEECRFQPNWTAIAVCLVIAALAAIATIFGCRHYIYEQKLASLLWKIDYRDLLVTDPDADPTMSGKTKRKAAPSSLSFLGLDEVMSRQERASRHPDITVASYKGQLVAVKALKRKHVELTRNIKKELQLLKEMQHDNINHFIGASLDAPNLCLVTQYCARGSLQDILDNEDLHLDDMFIASLVFDLIKGMIVLHETEIGSHGNLKPSNCLVDSRWVLQVADFGLQALKAPDISLVDDEEKQCQGLLWRAPELLRQDCPPPKGTPRGDVYSFALILFQIHSRTGPWGSTTLSAKEIIDRVKYPTTCAFRPNTSQLKQCHECVIKCMTECWQEEPEIRPDFKYVRVRLKPMQRGLKSNIFDNMLAMMEKYATNLEAIVDERTDLLVEEKKKTEALLLRMLPKSVADTLKRGCPVIPEHYESVSIYFSDIVGFTTLSAESSPMQVVDLLNDLYTTFDSIIGEYDVYKVETIGDAYMVVSGLPIRNGSNHAGEIASMSLHLLATIKSFRIRHRPDATLKLRIGIHSGSCVAGVVGLKMPRYCLFGDTVNTASRMESTGLPLKIHCSKECRDLLVQLGGYVLEDRGFVSMKGKGDRYTYFLTGEDRKHRLRRISQTYAMHNRLDPSTIPRVESGSSWSDDTHFDKMDGLRGTPSRNGGIVNERTYMEHEV